MPIDATQAEAIIAIINALTVGGVALVHAWRASTPRDRVHPAAIEGRDVPPTSRPINPPHPPVT